MSTPSRIKVKLGGEIRTLQSAELCLGGAGDDPTPVLALLSEKVSRLFSRALDGRSFHLTTPDGEVVGDQDTFEACMKQHVAQSAASLSMKLLVVAASSDEEDWDVVSQSHSNDDLSPGAAPASASASASASSAAARALDDTTTTSSKDESKVVLAPRQGLTITHPNWSSAEAQSMATQEFKHDAVGGDTQCTLCEQPIVGGVRYVCSHCVDPMFFLCETCEAKHAKSGLRMHAPTHPFLKIYNDAQQLPPYLTSMSSDITTANPDETNDGINNKKKKKKPANPHGIMVLGMVGAVPDPTHDSRVVARPLEVFYPGWKIRNHSREQWPDHWVLRRVDDDGNEDKLDTADDNANDGGDKLQRASTLNDSVVPIRPGDVMVPPLMYGGEADLLVELAAPAAEGLYRRTWRIHDARTSLAFGPPMTIEFIVVRNKVSAEQRAARRHRRRQQKSKKKQDKRKNKSKKKRGKYVYSDESSDTGSDTSGVTNSDTSGIESTDNSDDDRVAWQHGAVTFKVNKAQLRARPSVVYQSELRQLAQMGFRNRDVNVRFLRQGKTVQEIVELLLH